MARAAEPLMESRGGGSIVTLSYLGAVRALRPAARAVSIASYEDGGLSRVFSAMLRAPEWRGAGQEAFRFFLETNIKLRTYTSNPIDCPSASGILPSRMT